MRYRFIWTGKAEDVFKRLALAALADRLLEMKFGQNLEPLEPKDFGAN